LNLLLDFGKIMGKAHIFDSSPAGVSVQGTPELFI